MSLTRREQFVMAAVHGMLVAAYTTRGFGGRSEIIKDAILMSDALIAELDKTASENANDDWIAWAGGRRPVDRNTYVEVRFRDNKTWTGRSVGPRWHHYGTKADVIAYRIVRDADQPEGGAA